MFLVIIAGLIGGLLLIYLLRPTYEDRKISAVQFFDPLPEREQRSLRITLRSLTRSFWLQLLVLLTCLLAFLWWDVQINRHRLEAVGVWLLVDTSASMTTRQDNTALIDHAREEAHAALNTIEALPGDVNVCMNYATFDLSLRLIARNVPPVTVRSYLDSLTAESLGTDLSLIRDALREVTDAETSADCPVTHLVVISDTPVPDWFSDFNQTLTDAPEPRSVQLIWRDVSRPVSNTGITNLSRSGSALLGWNGRVDVEVTAYDAGNSPATIHVQDENGTLLNNVELDDWQSRSAVDVQTFSFSVDTAGLYTISLTVDDAYALDDSATIRIDGIQQTRVDWQLPDTTIPDLLQWDITATSPDLAVRPYPSDLVSDVPTLLVGAGYDNPGKTTSEIDFFVEASPILDDLSLDVAERLAIPGITLADESPLRPLLTGRSGGVWLAASESPLAAYVPGLPQDLASSSEADRFATTAFFNSLRWLLRERDLPPLYTLTTVNNPQPGTNRLVLHPGEGYTSQPQRHLNALADIAPVQGLNHREPLWALLVTVAVLLFSLERLLGIFGGRRWKL